MPKLEDQQRSEETQAGQEADERAANRGFVFVVILAAIIIAVILCLLFYPDTLGKLLGYFQEKLIYTV